MATFIDLADATYPQQIGDRMIDPLQGKSLLPIFRGETRAARDAVLPLRHRSRLAPGTVEAGLRQVGPVGTLQSGRDRTELNDLSAQQPERVAAMAAEWFRMAEHVDRLNPRQLAPVRNTITPLDFRKP